MDIDKKRDSMLVTVKRIAKTEGSLLQLEVAYQEKIYLPDPRQVGHKLDRVL